MVRLTDRPDMTLDVYRGRKTTTQQQQSKLVGVSRTFYFIPSSESSAYLKQIKCILSAVKKYRIFSLVTDTIFIFSL